jgi:hypothetical protein
MEQYSLHHFHMLTCNRATTPSHHDYVIKSLSITQPSHHFNLMLHFAEEGLRLISTSETTIHAPHCL